MGCFSLAFFIMASKLHGLYGGLPNKHSYVIIPQDHKSALASYFKPNKTSGAIYEGDPRIDKRWVESLRNSANPKSAKKTLFLH